MEELKIEKLDQLLKPSQTLIDYSVRRLTEAGDNYGSLMVVVDIHLEENGQNKTVHAVAKRPVPNDFLQVVFNPKVTFRNEITFYKEIVPCLRKFQKEQGIEKVIDCFPEYVASRFNLNGNDDDEIDNNVILLLENLKIFGFDTGDRIAGLDLDATLLILDDLAEFHSVPIAMRYVKPEVFKKEIMSKSIFQPYKQADATAEKGSKSPFEVTLDILSKDEYCRKSIDKISRVFAQNEANFAEGKNCNVKEPFATIVHSDLWVNNTMIKVVNGKAVKNKLVDFQFLELGSPARDVLFFLFTSVQLQVIEQKLNYLLDYYHDSLIKNLKRLKCDTGRFNRSKFEAELRNAMQYTEFGHCLFMLNPIYAPRGSAKELSEFDEKTFDGMFSGSVPEAQIVRSRFIVKTCNERSWI